ncbi:MAG: M48 family metallopeptidase [Akkermansiaceae bacterium]|nr:M48 family metallopeptidase [Akkermansiaceae bacterium]
MAKKPRRLLDCVIVHEMAHLREPTHRARFIAILDRHFPTWHQARTGLNELPLTAETWG